MSTHSSRIQISPDTFLFVFTIALALILRCASLSVDFLGEEEARLALQALDLLRGGPVSLDNTGSVLFTGLSFFLFGDSDLAARLPAATASSATVAGIWLLRPWTGRLGSPLAALLLATSPTISYLSPRLGGASMAVLLTLFAAWSISRYPDGNGNDRRLLWTMAIVSPLLLTLGPIGIAGILVIATYLVVEHFAFGSGLPSRFRLIEANRSGPYLIVSLWIMLVLVSPAIGGSADARLPGAVSFAEIFKIPPSGYSPFLPWARLLAYDLALLLLGLVSAAFLVIFYGRSMLRQRDSTSAFQRFIFIWTIIGAFALLLSGPTHHGLLVFLLTPLGISAGFLFQRVLDGLDFSEWRRHLYSLGVLGILFFWLIISVAILSTTGPGQRIDVVILAVTSLVLILLSLLWPLRTLRPNLGNLTIGVFVVGIFLNLHTISFLGSKDTGAELLIQPGVSHDTINAIRELAQIGTEAASDKSLKVAVDPSLGEPFEWYLRAATSLKFSAPDSTDDIYISITDAKDLGPDYSKLSLPYIAGWRPEGAGIKENLRWLYYREIPSARREQSTIFVWTKAIRF